MSRTVRNASTITNAPIASAAAYSSAARSIATANSADSLPTGALMFLPDLIQSETQINSRHHHIRFVFSEYKKYKDANSSGQLHLTGNQIDLPIPNNLVDTQSVVYTEEAMGTIAGLGVAAAAATENSFAKFGAAAAGAIGSSIPGIPPLDNKLIRYGAQSIGYAINPFMQVMLQNPAFKQFEFTWKLSPRNAKETEVLRDIIRMFRYNMLPGTLGSTLDLSKWIGVQLNNYAQGAANAILSYPNVVHAQLFPDDKYLFEFKPMVIETMSVNFTPSGTPSFFRDINGAPVEVVLTIRLKEIEIWLKEHVR